jgi:hypothetical protein
VKRPGENNVVRHANIVCVGNKTPIRSIVGKRGTQVVTDEAEVVPCFTTSVVENDESAAGGNGVG